MLAISGVIGRVIDSLGVYCVGLATAFVMPFSTYICIIDHSKTLANLLRVHAVSSIFYKAFISRRMLIVFGVFDSDTLIVACNYSRLTPPWLSRDRCQLCFLICMTKKPLRKSMLFTCESFQ